MTETEKAYIAGLLDGEGTISITAYPPHDSNHHSPAYNLRVEITNTYQPIIVYLKNTCGGQTIVSMKPCGRKRAAYRWTVTNQKALGLLEQLFPYLKIKKKEAEVAINFQKKIKRNCKRLSPDVVADRNTSVALLKSLKGRIRGGGMYVSFGLPAFK